MDPINGDQVYAAERLLDRRMRAGKQEYLVKWKGWSKNYNSWEPVENILDERLISEFNKSKEKKTPPKRKRGSTASKSTPAGADSKSVTATPSSGGKSTDDASPAAGSDVVTPPAAKRGRRSTRATANDDANTPSTSRRSGRVTRPPAKLGVDDTAAAAVSDSEYNTFDEADEEDSVSSERSASASAVSGGRKSTGVVSTARRGRKKTTPAEDVPAKKVTPKGVAAKTAAAAKIQRASLGTPPSAKVRRVGGYANNDEDEDDDEDEEEKKQSEKLEENVEVNEKKDNEIAGKTEDKKTSSKDDTKPEKTESAKTANKLDEQPKPNPIQLESSAAETSAADESMDVGESMAEAQEAVTFSTDLTDMPPDEIFVSKQNGSGEGAVAAANSFDTPPAEETTGEKDVFVVTNHDDPSCTHKIQVHKLVASGQSKTEAQTEAGNGETSTAVTAIASDGAKSSGDFETMQWNDRLSAPASETSGGTPAVAEPYQYNGAGVVTEVTANGSTVKILEI